MFKQSIIFFSIALFCPLAGMQEVGGSKKQCVSNDGKRFVGEFDIDLRFQELNKLSESDQSSPCEQLTYVAALSFLLRNQRDFAENLYKSLLYDDSCDPTIRSWAAYDLGTIRLRSGQDGERMKGYYQKSAALGLEKARTKLHNFVQLGNYAKNLGINYYKNEKYVDALGYLTIAQKNSPEDSELAEYLYRTCVKLDRDPLKDFSYPSLDDMSPESLSMNHVTMVQILLKEFFPELEEVD